MFSERPKNGRAMTSCGPQVQNRVQRDARRGVAGAAVVRFVVLVLRYV